MNKQGLFLGMPFDLRWPTIQRFKSRLWNKKDHRLFTPKTFGWGYSINFYELIHHRRMLLVSFLVVIVFLIIISGLQNGNPAF